MAQVCSLASSFDVDLQDYAAAHCPALEVWLTKLEQYVEQTPIKEVKTRLSNSGMVIPAASFQGGLLVSQATSRQAAWDLFQRRIELCCELEISTIILAGDIAGPLTQKDVERVRASLINSAQVAGQHGLRLAFEFQASAALANNLQTAAALVEEIGSPHLGLCLDAFHFYAGPSKFYDLEYLHAHNLFHVQLCDLADTPREFATDSDRILPGDGDIPLQPIIDRLEKIGYIGHVSVELMNPQLWQIPPRQLGEIAMTALRKLLGQAEM
jgi:sugar phosphate isomerase/epimerase